MMDHLFKIALYDSMEQVKYGIITKKYVGSDWYSNTATGRSLAGIIMSLRQEILLKAFTLCASNELYVTKMKDEDGGRVDMNLRIRVVK